MSNTETAVTAQVLAAQKHFLREQEQITKKLSVLRVWLDTPKQLETTVESQELPPLMSLAFGI